MSTQPEIVAQRPAEYQDGKLTRMGYKVRLVPLPKAQRKAYVDAIIEMAHTEELRRIQEISREN